MKTSDITARNELTAPLPSLRALVDDGLDWNYKLDISANAITYTFDNSVGMENGGAGTVALNASQQQAALQAMAKASAISGITFVQGDAQTADWHFAAKDIAGSAAGLTSTTMSWRSLGDDIVALDLKAYIYLDNRESADTNTDPSPGTWGYEVMLHEVGHALGLKHPFEGTWTLPAGEDNTDNTLMSYTDTGIHTEYSPYDVAALRYIYGGDGLGGLGLGPSSTGNVINGTSPADSYAGSESVDIVSGLWGNDLLSGGAGSDQLFGNQDSDTLYGNTGNDTLFGGQGDDVVFGGSDNDALYGNMMSDVVYGGIGADSLFGGQGDDRVFGDAGNDFLMGNLGNDTLTGGDGADTFFLSGGGNDVVSDFSGASGDRLILAGTTYTVGTAIDGSAVLTLTAGGTVTLSGVAPAALDGAWVS